MPKSQEFKMSSVARLFACVLLIILASGSLTGLAGQQYSFKKEIGGAGGWDFIDVIRQRGDE